jgi:hypothetical protein
MTEVDFQQRYGAEYDLPMVNYTNKLEKISNIRSAPLSPGMQEHVAEHREKSRNTRIKNIQFVYYNQKKRTYYSQPHNTRGKKRKAHTLLIPSKSHSVAVFISKRSAHHDGQRLWVIASPVALPPPNRFVQLHPHTVGDSPQRRFCRNRRCGRVIGGVLPKQIQSIFFIRSRPSPS